MDLELATNHIREPTAPPGYDLVIFDFRTLQEGGRNTAERLI
jgi:hypothetical protein